MVMDAFRPCSNCTEIYTLFELIANTPNPLPNCNNTIPSIIVDLIYVLFIASGTETWNKFYSNKMAPIYKILPTFIRNFTLTVLVEI